MTRWCTAFVLCAACGLSAPASVVATSQPPPDIVLRGVTLRNYRGNTLHMTATMPYLDLMRESTDLTASQVTATLASGTVLTSKTVGGNANESRIVGSDGVTFRSPDGVEGRAPIATYEKSLGPRGGAHGDTGVHLEHPKFSLDARAFTVDFATEHASFTAADTRTKGAAP